VRLRSAHLVCFLVLLATLGVANPTSCPAQEVTIGSRRGNLLRRTSPLGCPETHAAALRVTDPTTAFAPILSFGMAEIDRTGNLPASRCVALQAFTSSLR
jgi:hypothetical protein